jgi:hypothetical protein
MLSKKSTVETEVYIPSVSDPIVRGQKAAFNGVWCARLAAFTRWCGYCNIPRSSIQSASSNPNSSDLPHVCQLSGSMQARLSDGTVALQGHGTYRILIEISFAPRYASVWIKAQQRTPCPFIAPYNLLPSPRVDRKVPNHYVIPAGINVVSSGMFNA